VTFTRGPADAWTDGDDVELAALLEDDAHGESLREYIMRVSPAHVPPRHLSPLLQLWERTRHERVLALVELPPRHAKTTTGLHGLAWRLHRDPTLTNALANRVRWRRAVPRLHGIVDRPRHRRRGADR
jgi:hypothetical protein